MGGWVEWMAPSKSPMWVRGTRDVTLTHTTRHTHTTVRPSTIPRYIPRYIPRNVVYATTTLVRSPRARVDVVVIQSSMQSRLAFIHPSDRGLAVVRSVFRFAVTQTYDRRPSSCIVVFVVTLYVSRCPCDVVLDGSTDRLIDHPRSTR